MKAKELALLIIVVTIIAMLIIPLPSWLLSVGIMFNITIAFTVLLVSMNVKEPLQFSVFPTLLLIMTLFRLGLNVSTTRAILSEGHAGGVVETFGTFVIGGNVIVGFVIFLILIIIQFIVITKGAERVSEVAARFTLDAMPGKQMSIDADLNAGIISEQEARVRREKISNEADFYGSMDGASKFVKGDAIAGIVIVIINMLFGIVIGMLQMDMSISEAASRFTLLTVGDGLVSQIPALLLSTATGIIVTRAASQNTLSFDVFQQLTNYPVTLYVTGVTIFLLGLFTPIHDILTISIALLLIISGYNLSKPKQDELVIETDPEEELAPHIRSLEGITKLLTIDPVEFEFGYGLVPLADANQGGDLLDRIVMIRRQLALELGIIMPTVRIRDNISLSSNGYSLKIKGAEVGKGELLLDHYLLIETDMLTSEIRGIPTIDPSFGLPAKWIDENEKEKAETLGLTVIDPPSIISTHLTELFRKHASELVGRQEVKELIEHIRETHPILVDEVTPNPLTIGDIQRILVNLLKENISIRNLVGIFETLADFTKWTTEHDSLTEYVRQGLSQQISKQYAKNGRLRVVTFSARAEKLIAEHIQRNETGSYLVLEPSKTHDLYNEITEIYENLPPYDELPVILCSPATRIHVKRLLQRVFPTLTVLSYSELEPTIEIQSVGVVKAL